MDSKKASMNEKKAGLKGKARLEYATPSTEEENRRRRMVDNTRSIDSEQPSTIKKKGVFNGKARLEYAAPFPSTNEVVCEATIHETVGAINIVPGNQPERRAFVALNEFHDRERFLLSGNDDPPSPQEFITIANANLVKPEDEEARIIGNFVNTMVRADVVEQIDEKNDTRSNNKKRFYCILTLLIIVIISLTLIFIFIGKEPTIDPPDKEPTNEDKIFALFNAISEEDQLLEDGSPQNIAYSLLLGDNVFLNNTTEAVLLERYIALVFYFSTSGEDWNIKLNITSNTSICEQEWEGGEKDIRVFECNPENRIVSINAANNNLTGNLSSEIFHLQSLERILLKNNNLHGTIPSLSSDMKNLASLDLSNNALTGTIPEVYMESKTMRDLNLGYNKLSGSIPDFSRGVGHDEIHLNHNELTGNIPRTVSALSSLKVVNFRNNQLNGTIPSGISEMESLERMFLNSNHLSGSIPYQMENLKDLNRLDLRDNKLDGTIPRNLASLNKLNQLNLERNDLTGTIPTELAELLNLVELSLSDNRLTGTFPKEFASSKVLLFIDIHANSIKDSLDEDFCSEDNEHEFHIAADCLGLDSRVQCSCCDRCWNDDGEYLMNDSSICNYKLFAEILMGQEVKEGVTCNCKANQFLECTLPPENPCEVCNTGETTCIRINSIVFEYDLTRNVAFSLDMKYIKGGDSSISVGTSVHDYCSMTIDGKKCENCEIQECGPNGQRVPLVSCENNDGISDEFNGCNDNVGNVDAGIFEFLVLIMEKKIVSKDSCNVPYIFDLNSIFIEF